MNLQIVSTKKKPFALLDPRLKHFLEEVGFERRNDKGWITWNRRYKDDYGIALNFQLWKYGYNTWLGSKFVVNFFRTIEDREVTPARNGLQCRARDLMDRADCRVVAEIQNQILQKIRIPTPDEILEKEPWQSVDYFLSKCEEWVKPVSSEALPQDFWLKFTNSHDILTWADWLESWLPKALQRIIQLEHVTGILFDPPDWDKE